MTTAVWSHLADVACLSVQDPTDLLSGSANGYVAGQIIWDAFLVRSLLPPPSPNPPCPQQQDQKYLLVSGVIGPSVSQEGGSPQQVFGSE